MIETRTFQAEVQELLGLVIHSLYKHEEIFLRELVSNASDACDKLRFEALTDPALGVKEDELAITIEVDRTTRTLTVSDNGIGMSRDELAENLGTIARSGTKAFLRELKDKGGTASPALIGQFGVGFYSSFIVADRVVVESRRAGASEAWRWTSEGKGEFTIEAGARATRGTSVTLHLRPHGADEEHPQDFTSAFTLRGIVKKYSDFVAFPIRMEVERWEPKEGGKPGEGATVRAVETLNSMRPLWTRAKDEITADEHAEFYRHLAHDFEAPLETIHFKAEGTLEYTALLYVPARRPMDLFSSESSKSSLQLYVKRVLILGDCHDLLPPWLRFAKGVVDAPDLPLNVARDVLQQNAQVRQIQKRLTKRVCESLAQMLEKDRARYAGFWTNFGMLIKEGIYSGGDEDQRLSKLALFPTTHGAEATTLVEYVARMKAGQEAIWYLAGDEKASLEGSPHLEDFAKRGEEVLFFVDPVDEWLLERFREFDGKPLRAIDREGAHVESTSEKEAREALEREHRATLSAIERELANHVKAVRFSTRLTESPAALVSDENAIGPNMERLMRAANQTVEPQKRVLELNPDHALFQKLARLCKEHGETSPEFQDHVALLHGQALLAEGSSLPEPGRFARLLAKLLA
ncbi:MAG: molecular chaperone HtpG [Planctomycetes bacterium]|nr:molecular chaperone HtpG [Planctomycetota bacterium]